jgi:hypothetical protein
LFELLVDVRPRSTLMRVSFASWSPRRISMAARFVMNFALLLADAEEAAQRVLRSVMEVGTLKVSSARAARWCSCSRSRRSAAAPAAAADVEAAAVHRLGDGGRRDAERVVGAAGVQPVLRVPRDDDVPAVGVGDLLHPRPQRMSLKRRIPEMALNFSSAPGPCCGEWMSEMAAEPFALREVSLDWNVRGVAWARE